MLMIVLKENFVSSFYRLQIIFYQFRSINSIIEVNDKLCQPKVEDQIISVDTMVRHIALLGKELKFESWR